MEDKITQIKDTYGVKSAVFVGDCGMITKNQFELIQENETNYIKTISALTHAQLAHLCEKDCVQISMFDEHKII